MNNQLLLDLNQFMGRASTATYASDAGKVEPMRQGFTELAYQEGDWYYRDSYAGFLRSWGQEVIWYKDKPTWVCSYGGGMTAENMDVKTANDTFTFLRKVFLAGDKQNKFQPRGPADFEDGNWKYHCELSGDITKFGGNEFISHNDNVLFTHDFVGGLVIDQSLVAPSK